MHTRTYTVTAALLLLLLVAAIVLVVRSADASTGAQGSGPLLVRAV